MMKRLQLGWMVRAALSVMMLVGSAGGVAFAQSSQSHPDRPPKSRSAPAPHANTAPKTNNNTRSNTSPQNTNRPPEAQTNRPASNYAPSGNRNHPPTSTIGPERSNNYTNFSNRPSENSPSARMKPRQEVAVGAPRPFVDRMRDLTPRERDSVLQNSKAFQNLAPEQQSRIKQQFNQWDRMTPGQRADLRAKEDTWRRMTPDQRDYVKNQVLPKWKQIPWERQQVIQQKLGVLQNMPESARNRRLNDPDFTRGMNEEDKATLHDLSHLHVGGAPDPPSNEQ